MNAKTAASAPKEPTGLKVRTTGDFMLLDPVSRVEFDPRVATATEMTNFVERRIKNGDLEIVK